MPPFSYVARRADGSLLTGTMDAPTERDVRASLSASGLQVESCDEMPATLPMDAIGSPWTVTEAPPANVGLIPSDTQQDAPASKKERSYHPLIETIRLYAGWLTAWYFLIFALGTYQRLSPVPFQSQFLEQLLASRLVLNVAVATFLFLLLSGIHRKLGRGVLFGFAMTILGMGLFLLFAANA